jgi:hypothetical protein
MMIGDTMISDTMISDTMIDDIHSQSREVIIIDDIPVLQVDCERSQLNML